MKTSEAGIAFIKAREGLVLVPTPDNGKMMIGHGHDILPGEDFSAGITPAGADTLLRKDLATRYEPSVNGTLARLGYTANQNQFDALIDFDYNLGPGDLMTMLAHGWDQVPVQIVKWVYITNPVTKVKTKSENLITRRNLELQLFQTSVAS